MKRGGIVLVSPWLGLLVCMAGGSAPGGDPPSAHPPTAVEGQPDPGEEQPKLPVRLREGMVWTDRTGHFQSVDLRFVFRCTEDERSYTVLENLALERVARAIGDSSEDLRWSVSGVVTEFNGQNYLLVTRAILKAGEAAE